MASLSFSYRSPKPKANLEVRFAYRVEKNAAPISFYSRSKIEVEKSYWKNHKKKFIDTEIQKYQADINSKMIELRTFVLGRFERTSIENVNKEWFLNVLDEYYNPKAEPQDVVIPNLIVDYVQFYLDHRDGDVTHSTVKKYNVVKNKLIGLQKSLGKEYEIKDINESFKSDFVKYYKDQKYAKNTAQRALTFVKTLCKHAKTKGVETHPEMDSLTLKRDDDVPKVWLTYDDLEKIENVTDLPDYLDNARDWLIISCYTGQRVSDLLRFNSKMIREKKERKLLDFRQQKTQRDVSIAMHGKVLQLLDKRNGEFPRKISDQRYNEYIKEVSRRAGLNEPTKGRLKVNISKDKNIKKMRMIEGIFPKWELTSSHIGRRSFATNFYGHIPLPLLMNATGHKSEAQLLEYLGKGSEDLALETFKYF